MAPAQSTRSNSDHSQRFTQPLMRLGIPLVLIGRRSTTENLGVSLVMHARVVREAALRASIGLAGIEIQLEDGADWADRPVYGYTDPSGAISILFPRAFESEESLVKTLGHERVHAYQAKIFGPVRSSLDAAAREKAAYASEEMWWKSYRGRL